jgi:hypothetical protein
VYAHDEESEQRLSEYDHLTKYFEQAEDIAYTVLWDACRSTPEETSGRSGSASTDKAQEEVSAALGTNGNGASGNEMRTGVACASGNEMTGVACSSYTSTPGATTVLRSSCLLSHTKFDSIRSCEKDHSNDDSMEGLRREGQMFRRNVQLADNTKVFLAIGWVFKPELRYFKLFPEVIHVDGTSHSTRKKYELITFSVKTSLGQQVVFLRVWLPDQKRYSFRWVFQHVMLSLVPRECFQRTRLVMRSSAAGRD